MSLCVGGHVGKARRNVIPLIETDPAAQGEGPGGAPCALLGRHFQELTGLAGEACD